ncbi:MAG: hypothetical protein AAGJ40_09280 [Planctomycetota bacterium]
MRIERAADIARNRDDHNILTYVKACYVLAMDWLEKHGSEVRESGDDS